MKSSALFWEALQNAPLIVGLLGGIRASGSWHQLVWCLAGGLVGAVLIALTEHMIEPGHEEPVERVLGNILLFSLGLLLLVMYLQSEWATWRSDIALSLAIGLVVGLTQTAIAGQPRVDTHMLGLILAGTLALLSIRMILRSLISLPLLIAGGAMLDLVLSGIMVWLDY